MVPTAGSKFSLVLLVLAVLPDCPRASHCPLLHGDDHYVYYDFNISSNKKPWCMTQVQMDGKNFFSYDCGSNEVISMNLLREEVVTTETWREQTTKLRDIGNSIKEHLPAIKAEKHADRGSFTLQVRMTCQCNTRGNYSGSWEFGWNGKRFLVFDLESGQYTVGHSGGEQLKEKWEEFKKLAQELKITLKGDCKKWLQYLVPWKKELGTAGAPITAPTTATPSTVTGAPAQTQVTIITTSVIFAVVLVLVLIFFLRRFLRSNRRCCSEAPECGLVQHLLLLVGCPSVSSCSPAELQELQSLQQMQRPPEDPEDTADAIPMSFIA
ncbi:UL16-binding protein 3-like [Molossus molossus]|uniref:UL16-binding protein 3-like n=1 Tax=Molossus molossus TaxID=27622 RepID=UPI001746BD5B|nr:UL16-binding protein 3-like [Molossus molossus]